MNSALVGVASTARSLSLQVRPIRHGTGSGRPNGPPGSGHVHRLHCTWLHSPIGRSGLHSRSEEHTSELQSLMRISYAVFCLKKKKITIPDKHTYTMTQ